MLPAIGKAVRRHVDNAHDRGNVHRQAGKTAAWCFNGLQGIGIRYDVPVYGFSVAPDEFNQRVTNGAVSAQSPSPVRSDEAFCI